MIIWGERLYGKRDELEMEAVRRTPRPRRTMSGNATDNTAGPATDDDQSQRYAELTLDDDAFVIYDRENHQAWIQSTVAVPIEDYQ